MPVEVNMSTEKERHGGRGFTLIEVIAALLLLGLVAVFGSSIITRVAKGYVLARSTDEVVQKAQIALQRMTIEFSCITTGSRSGSSHYIYYNTNEIGIHNIYLDGTNIMYTQGVTPYVLLDGVSSGGLTFTYYNAFNGSNSSSFSDSTNIVGISLTMHGDDWPEGLTKTFTTRVAIKNY